MYKNNSIHYKLARRETGLKEVEEEKVAKRYEKNDGLRRTSDGNADKVAEVTTGRRRVEQGLDEVPGTRPGARHSARWGTQPGARHSARDRAAGAAKLAQDRQCLETRKPQLMLSADAPASDPIGTSSS